MNISVSAASPDDAEELLAIYAPYVQNTAVSFEYAVPSVNEFRQRIEKTLEKYPYLVAGCDGEIVGYAYASPFKSRPAYDRAVETSIYVRQDERGWGVGRLLYSALEKALRMQNILNANACIVYSEEESEVLTKASMYFHEKMGYRLVGHFSKCGYKFGRWFDMIWMEKQIGEHTDSPESVRPFPEIRDQFEKEYSEKGENNMQLDNILTGVQHIGIPTADMAATEKFYFSLGFEKVFETLLGGTQKVCFFSKNNVCFECYESDAAAMKYGAVDHVSLNVTDVEEAYRQALEGGYKIVSSGLEQLPFFSNGVKFFTIEGPNKEKVEFNQYL